MHERLRCGERVVFDDSSHMPHIEEPDRFLAVVQDFLARCEA
jgi:pimeloyl-ACP methyl ester carboxylesterase